MIEMVLALPFSNKYQLMGIDQDDMFQSIDVDNLITFCTKTFIRILFLLYEKKVNVNNQQTHANNIMNKEPKYKINNKRLIFRHVKAD